MAGRAWGFSVFEDELRDEEVNRLVRRLAGTVCSLLQRGLGWAGCGNREWLEGPHPAPAPAPCPVRVWHHSENQDPYRRAVWQSLGYRGI